MINLRAATEQDIPAIIELLKLSLGEGSSQKSVDYWRWKHVINPFGPSPVLLADNDGQVVGVRAFMRWTWQDQQRTYAALRAVDTATHPDFRGQGIFKKLTLRLLEECSEKGDDFIFNTPNEQSRPGYLKMGWQPLGQVPVRLRLRRPLAVLGRKLGILKYTAKTIVEDYGDFPVGVAIQQLAEAAWWQQPIANKLSTPLSKDYLNWRYRDCPVQSYGAVGDEDFLLVFYVREQALGRELRLVQLIVGEQADRRSIRNKLRELSRHYQIDYCSIAPASITATHKMINQLRFLPSLALGPILTFRSLQNGLEELEELSHWEYDLGTLELF